MADVHICAIGDGMTRDDLAGMPNRQGDRQAIDKAAQYNGRPHMGMHLARGGRPGPRRNPNGGQNARHPLKEQQRSEHAIGSHVKLLPMLVKQFRGASLHRGIGSEM